MKILKVWHFVCLVFGFQSLDTLIEESHEVTYAKTNKTDQVQSLACNKLTDLLSNQTIDLKELSGDLYRHFNSSPIYGYWRRKRPIIFEQLLLNRTKAAEYLLWNEMLCFSYDDPFDLLQIESFFPKLPAIFVINRQTFDFVKLASPIDFIYRLTVVRKAYPYSDCSKSNARFFCLNECFKKRFRLSSYLYIGSETGLVHLNYSDRNQTIRDHEMACFEKCKRENCKMVQMILRDFSKDSEIELFVAQPKLSDYWVQFIGLICSFAGLSFREIISITIEFAASKVRKRKWRISLICLQWAILLTSLALFGHLTTTRILDHKKRQPEVETRMLIQPEIVHLAICPKIEEYENKTMLEIERATDGALNDSLKGIFVTYQDKSFKSNYQVRPKVWLFNYKRCFSLSIQPNYQTLPSNPKLTIKFNKKEDAIYPHLYVLGENENLNWNSFSYSGEFSFMKRITKRLKSSGKCVDYEEKYERKYANCTGPWNCVDACKNRKLIKRFNKIIFDIYANRPIDRDCYSSIEWATFYSMQILPDQRKVYGNITRECLEEIPDEKPCTEIQFEKTVKISQPDEAIEIDLQLDVVVSTEKSSSFYKLLLDLVSLQSIFFGLTVFGSLQTLCFLVQTRLKMRKNKIVFFSIYLICFLGGSWNTYHIFDVIIRGELVPTHYYQLNSEVQVPDMVFCLKINQSLIDENHQLTGKYLYDLTRQLTTESLFSNITYLDRSNKWTPFNFSLVEQFFFQNLKCFKIKIDLLYKRNQFHFSSESQILRVNFTRAPGKKEQPIVYFMTISKETAEFSKMISLQYIWFPGHQLLSPAHSVTHQWSLYQYEDRFSFIREHFTSFQEGDLRGLNEQLLALKSNEHKLATLNLPIEKNEFKLEIDKDLFNQLYKFWKQTNPNKRTNNQLFVDNHLGREYKYESEFTLSLNFLQKIVLSTNKENFGKLILALLNVLFVWFDLSVLDLHPVCFYSLSYLFNKVNQILLFAFKYLKQFKRLLFQLLAPFISSKQNSQRDFRF